jgi:hypothetical protein
MPKIWHTRGNTFATDYTVGDDPLVKFAAIKFDPKSVPSIEGHVLSTLAAKHEVNSTEIGIIHIIRTIN